MILLFLPAATCLFWIFLIFFISRRTSSYWLLTTLSVVLMMYFAADAIYSTPGRNTYMVVYSHIMSTLAGPSVIPLLWLYFDKIRWHRRFRPIQYFWILIPISLLFATLALTGAMGRDAVASFLWRLYTEGPGVAAQYKGQLEYEYFLWASLGYRIIVGVEFAVAIIYTVVFMIRHKISFINVWRYFRNGESVRVVELQLSTMIIAGVYILSKVFFFKDIFDSHPWIAVAQAVLVSSWYFAFMLCSLLGEKKKVTLVQAQHVMFYNYNQAIKGPIVEMMMDELLDEAEQDALLRFQEKIGETLHMDQMTPAEMTAVKEKLFSSVAGSWDDSLLARFQNLMVNEQLFLQPSLSLGDIAERLHTNKTYISKLVNNTYNLSFPELLNTLRIDYAEQYLLNHRDAKQSEVAQACGFLSASSFNNIFKKITGMTPKVWLVARDRQNAQ